MIWFAIYIIWFVIRIPYLLKIIKEPYVLVSYTLGVGMLTLFTWAVCFVIKYVCSIL